MSSVVTPERRDELDGDDAAERCLRCGALMEWRHSTFQCPRCRFKIGCCEGATGECTAG